MTLLVSTTVNHLQAAEAEKPVVLVIHGGAGPSIQRDKISPELEREYRAALGAALRAGYQALDREAGASLDAVEAAVRALEDCGLFDAGRGSVFTREGRTEMDAAIMDGKTRAAGAVAAVNRIRNPITAARAVMEKSEHVLIVGDGADRFALSQGLPEVNPLYFWSEKRWKELLEAQEKHLHKQAKTGDAAMVPGPLGTVGAVALDRFGNLAAGTSTGGWAFKRAGRVGDTPIIGAGTYADNETCAVSCTGHGEIFMRYVVAHDVAALVRYRGLSVKQAAEEVFLWLSKEPLGVGGLIALDRKGRFTTTYNTPGMYRAYATKDGDFHVAIFER